MGISYGKLDSVVNKTWLLGLRKPIWALKGVKEKIFGNCHVGYRWIRFDKKNSYQLTKIIFTKIF